MFCVRRDDRARRNLHGAKDIQERRVPLDNAKVWPVRFYKGSKRNMKTPITPAGLQQYDNLDPCLAIAVAWTNPGDKPAWHSYAKAVVREAMPVLARSLDRLAATYERQIRNSYDG